jgi:hypothetical protein
MEVTNEGNFCNTVYFKPAATITCSAIGGQYINQRTMLPI